MQRLSIVVFLLLISVSGNSQKITTDWKFLFEEGKKLYNENNWPGAIQKFIEARNAAIIAIGKTNVEYSAVCGWLGYSYYASGDFPNAEVYLLESLETDKKVLGENHTEYAADLHNLGVIYKGMQFPEKAETVLLHAKTLREKLFGKQNEDYLSTITELASLYEGLAKPKQAIPFLEDAVEQRRALTGEDAAYSSLLTRLGSAYLDDNRFHNASEIYRRALDVDDKLTGKNSEDYAVDLLNLSNSLTSEKKFTEAEALLKESLSVRKQVYGIQSERYLTALLRLADLYRLYKEEMPPAEPLYRQARDIIVKLHGKQNTGYTDVLYKLGTVEFELKHYDSAYVTYNEKLTLDKKLIGTENEEYGVSLFNTAAAAYHLKKLWEAESLLHEAFLLRRKLLGKDNESYISCLIGLKEIYKTMGSHYNAQPVMQEYLDYTLTTYGKTSAEYLEALISVAEVAVSSGLLPRGEQLLLEALRLSQTHHASTGEMDIALALGDIYSQTGDLKKAESNFLTVQRIAVEKSGFNSHFNALGINGMTSIYLTVGNFRKAEELAKQSIGIYETIGKLEYGGYTAALNNLAAAYLSQNKFDESLALYEESLTVLKNRYGEWHPMYAGVLSNISTAFYGKGDLPQAISYAEEAVAKARVAYGSKHDGLISALNNLGLCLVENRSYAQAVEVLTEARQAAAATSGNKSHGYIMTLNNLAIANYRRQRFQQARDLFRESASLRTWQINTYFPTWTDQERTAFLKENRSYLTNIESFCISNYNRDETLISDVFNQRLATKGLLFYTNDNVRRAILNSSDETLRALFKAWNEKKDGLAKSYSSPDQSAEVVKHQQQTEKELEELEKQLMQRSSAFSLHNVREYRWIDIKEKLKPGEAAVEIVRTIFNDGNASSIVYAVLIVKKTTANQPEIVLLKNGQELEEKFVKYYRNAIKSKIDDNLSYDQFWRPIAEKLTGIKTVYVSPDGVFNQISIPALLNPQTKTFVADEIALNVISSSRDLLFTSANTNVDKKREVILFGYPNYKATGAKVKTDSLLDKSSLTPPIQADSAQRFFDGENIAELPGTKEEVEKIAELLRSQDTHLKYFLFNDATEENLKTIKRPAVLHIATHGYFLPDGPNVARKTSPRMMSGQNTEVNPLLKSGLLLAGASSAFRGENHYSREDGILTAYEALSLDLHETSLVVLSACETGLGVTQNGEGVYGLQRAFLGAGATRVLISLWTVSDEATEKLMTQFYTHWLSGKNPDAAFRLAQASLRKEFPHPYYWAAFQFVGVR